MKSILQKRGQITVLALLMGLLGLTLSLAVASRSLSDLKQVTVVDSGTRALAAAEAGLQLGAADLENTLSVNGPVSACPPGTWVTPTVTLTGIQTVQYNYCNTTVGTYDTVSVINTDEVVDIDLSGASIAPTPKGFNVYWQGTGSVEVVVLGNGYVARRFGSNDATNSHAGNGFSAAVWDPANCNPAYTGWSCYTAPNYNPQDVLMRVKPLYTGSRLVIESQKSGSGQQTRLNAPSYIITAFARTTNGTVKKVQLTWTRPALPGAFDAVIFSGGDLSK